MNRTIIIDSLKKIDELLLDLRKMGCVMPDDTTIGQLKEYLLKQLGKCVYGEASKTPHQKNILSAPSGRKIA